MKRQKYAVNDRIAFMAKGAVSGFKGKPGYGLKHYVGYVKGIRHSWLRGLRYVVCVAKSDEIKIVPSGDIFGLVVKKDKTSESLKNE